jgi:hypothetical protein
MYKLEPHQYTRVSHGWQKTGKITLWGGGGGGGGRWQYMKRRGMTRAVPDIKGGPLLLQGCNYCFNPPPLYPPPPPKPVNPPPHVIRPSKSLKIGTCGVVGNFTIFIGYIWPCVGVQVHRILLRQACQRNLEVIWFCPVMQDKLLLQPAMHKENWREVQDMSYLYFRNSNGGWTIC